ncbi:4Fe-4S binding protein [Sphaerisporangium sp. NPDC051017]|uniref:NuoI/complex I 23 kDa subunit family protein n=1 Tax=Sphaerisporangium sp. NPDC051017 TaxID=3154636 RepID=UPI0034224A60
MAKGLAVTLRHMLSKSETRQYPEVRPELPPRSRGVIALVEENCTVCMLCARECPDWCIYIDSHKETTPAPEGGRPRAHNVLDRFAIDFSLCMYCGICIEVCPFDALFWSPEFEYAEYDIRDLLHEKDRLGEWVQTIPIPPPHDPNAEPPKELTASTRTTPTRPSPGTSAPRTGVPTPTAGAPAPTSGGSTPPTAGPTPTSGDPTPTTGAPAPASGAPASESAARAAVRAIRPPGALPKKPAPAQSPSQPVPAEPAAGGDASGDAGRVESPGEREEGSRSRGEEGPPESAGPARRS